MKSLPGSAIARPMAYAKTAALAAAVVAPAALTVSCSPTKIDSSCPQVFIAQDLGMIRRYEAGTNQEPSNLQFLAEMRDIKGDCKVKSGDADVQLTFSIVGERGANDHSGPNGRPLAKADIVYFAALTDPSGAIIYKQQFTTSLDFGDNRRAGSQEELDPHIPLPKNGTASGYKVLLGFQLTPQEVDDNRRQRGAPLLDAPPPAPVPPRPVTPAPLPPLPAPPPAASTKPATPPAAKPARRPVPPPHRPAPRATPSPASPETPAPFNPPSTTPATPAPNSGSLEPGQDMPAPSGGSQAPSAGALVPGQGMPAPSGE